MRATPTSVVDVAPVSVALAVSESMDAEAKVSNHEGAAATAGPSGVSSGESWESQSTRSTSEQPSKGVAEPSGGAVVDEEEELKGFARFWPPSRGTVIKLCVLAAFIALVVVAFTVFRIQDHFGTILDWVDRNPVSGAFAFAALYAVCVVLFVPGVILSLGAGLVFGAWQGALVVWIGATIGQTAAFPLGRFLFRDWIASKTAKWQTWQAVEVAIKDEAWKIVFLLRLAPLVPYSALNYALGLTSVGFVPYAVASWIGILPGTFLYTYFGSLATDIASIVRGDADIDPKVTIITAVISGVVIIAVIVIVTYYAKKALRKSLDAVEEGGDAAEESAVDIEAPQTETEVEGAAAGKLPSSL